MSPTAPPPTGSPAPEPDPDSHPARDKDDQRPGLPVRLAAALLNEGREPLDVASATGVPLALVELINNECGQQPPGTDPTETARDLQRAPTPPPRPPTSPTRSPTKGAGDLPRTRSGSARRLKQPAGRRVRWAARTVRMAFLLNAALAAAAALTHGPALAEASLIAIPLTFAALGPLWLWATRPPKTPASRPPPRPRP